VKKIEIYGEIGSGNLGDDWGYWFLKRQLQEYFDKRDILVDIIRASPLDYEQMNNRPPSAVFLGCGTLLDKSCGSYMKVLKSARDKGIPYCVVGSGLSDPAHISNSADGENVYRDLRSNAVAWYERGSAPDIMFGIDVPYEGICTGKVGINFGRAAWAQGGIYNIRDRLKLIIADMTIAKIPFDLISFWSADNDYLNTLGSSNQLICDPKQWPLLRQYEVIVSFRVHGAALAYMHGCAIAQIDYSSKCRDVFKDVTRGLTFLDPNTNWRDAILELLGNKQNRPDNNVITRTRFQVRSYIKDACDRLCSNWGV
jgi:hypothetical protein